MFVCFEYVYCDKNDTPTHTQSHSKIAMSKKNIKLGNKIKIQSSIKTRENVYAKEEDEEEEAKVA